MRPARYRRNSLRSALLAKEDLLIDRFEIEREIECATHPRSRNFERRVLNANACIVPMLQIGNSSITTRFSATAGKLYSVAQFFAVFSICQSIVPALNASKATLGSRK